jgi:DNA gyrase subunit A
MFFTQKENVLDACLWNSEGSKTIGKTIQNLINIESDDKVKAFICTIWRIKSISRVNLVMVTKQGQVKKTSRNILKQNQWCLQLP